jgi:hypothetical protein
MAHTVNDCRTCGTVRTRQKAVVFGIGDGITNADADITGSRLPTGNQVLRCYMFYQGDGLSINRTKRENAKLVLQKIQHFYERSNIPMLTEKKACEKIIKLFQKNAKLREIPMQRRSSLAAQAKIAQMQNELSRTFPLWTKNAHEIIKNPEDIAFLESMQTDRVASLGCHDKKLAGHLKRKKAREDQEAKRRLKAQQSQELSRIEATEPTHVMISESSNEESSSEEDDDVNFEPPAEKVPKVKSPVSGTTAFIPHNILKSTKLVSLATRMKISPAQQAVFTQAFIEESGGNGQKVSASYATADRARRSVNSQIATAIYKRWVPPQFASVHWDSKLMKNPETHVLEERLTVSVGDKNETKLLGVPAYLPGSYKKAGDKIAEATVKLLQDWNCEQSVVNMTFDTTASNTGQISAACITLQLKLGRALLWSACRHHVGEIILTHVFNDLNVEASKAPECMLFLRFQKNFGKIPHDSEVSLRPLDKQSYSDEARILIDDWQRSTIAIAENAVEHKRDDYKEFSELCLLFLDREGREFCFRRPGAVHKARWMAKILYSIKMVLLEEQLHLLPVGLVITRSQQPKLREFVTFVCWIYCRWWLTSTSVVDAPWHDLQLFQNLLKYEKINSIISSSALKAVKRHLWYLCSEMLPLALFSDLVPDSERKYLAEQLLLVQPADAMAIPTQRFGTGFGKPKFPADIISTTRLGDLVTCDSWLFFKLLDMDVGFLQHDVVTWPGQASYLSSKMKTAAVNVVNDSAERGVKLSADFLDAARSEKHFQNILHVVEVDRKLRPNLRKKRVPNTSD